jgi:hypothetical protein
VDLRRCSRGIRDDDKRIDFEVCKLAVDINSIQSCDEVDEDIVDALRDFLQESRSKFFVGGVLREVNGDENLLGFGVDITNIDTSLVCEENPVTLDRKYMVSTWHMKGGCLIGGQIKDGAEETTRLARAKGAVSGHYQAHADAGTKLHVDSMRFV